MRRGSTGMMLPSASMSSRTVTNMKASAACRRGGVCVVTIAASLRLARRDIRPANYIGGPCDFRRRAAGVEPVPFDGSRVLAQLPAEHFHRGVGSVAGPGPKPGLQEFDRRVEPEAGIGDIGRLRQRRR